MLRKPDAAEFVEALRTINMRPHGRRISNRRRSVIYQPPVNRASESIQKRIDEAFGWIKAVAGMRKTKP